MNLALLLPAGLAALAALLLPPLIHMARRSEQRMTDFAALRWLAAKARPQRKRRFDERLLLLLRLLLLAALALLLARPVLFGKPDSRPWIVAMPEVGVDALRKAAATGDARLHWLAPGFPGIDDGLPDGHQPMASLLRELDRRLPANAPLTVLVPTVIDGADAERPKLVRRVEWRVLPSAIAVATTSATTPVPDVAVRYATEDLPALRYLRAAGVAWQATDSLASAGSKADAQSPISMGPASQALDATPRNLVWLVPGPLPPAVSDWIRAGGHALLAVDVEATGTDGTTALWRDDDGDVLVRGAAFGRGRMMQFTRHLSPDAMPQLLDAGFAERLRALFADADPPPSRVPASAYAPTTVAAPWPETPRPLSPWLIALVALLFLAERWIASGARRGAEA